MSGDKDATFTLKAVINKQKNKVLFAEIENDLANVLLGFMTLPLGRIVQLLKKHYGENTHVIGSLNTLYNGVANLDCSHFKSKDKKQMLLDPGSAYSSPFQNMNLSFYCSAPTGPLGKSVTGNFVKNSASFIVSDDLRMHNVKRSFAESLDYVGVAMADLDGAETRMVTFRLNEIMDLLKGLFTSHHPLTDIILGTKRMKYKPVKSEYGNSLYDLIENEAISDSKEMTVSLTFVKSTKKFLFAQVDHDFVDLLFSMLMIPLGAVGHLFVFRSGLNNIIDNLYRSMSDMDRELFNDLYTRNWLLGYRYVYGAQSFLTTLEEVQKSIYVDSRSREFIVTDDLTVTPFSMCSTLSLLNQMKISASDVEELELHIGLKLKELVLCILQASLKSTCAMTDGLTNFVQLKREQRKLKRCRHT